MSLLIRNIGTLLSGDVRSPLLNATSLFVDGQKIASVGEERAADVTIDAAGGLVSPGLWDANHHAYFGDHNPEMDPRGYLDRTVRAGVTSLVSSGTVDLPGRTKDALGAKMLAILSARSWRLDRPRDLKMHAGTVIAAPGLTEKDFADLRAAGVGRLSFLDPVPSTKEANSYVDWARGSGMKVMARVGGVKLIDDASSIGDALRAIQPDVASHVNGGPIPAPSETLEWLAGATTCALDLALLGSPQIAAEVATQALERDQPERIVLSTNTPSAGAIAPAGVPYMVQLLALLAKVRPETAIAFATGNAARAFGLPGGRIAVGEPADLFIGRPAEHAPYTDNLEALANGSLAIGTVMVDGSVQYTAD
jgi:enamidase